MALSIGTLVGYLQLDDSNFNRKADNADRKLNALKLHLDALKRENPKISVQVDTETKKIDELKARIAGLKEQAARGADVRVDIVQAMVELDAIQAKIRELHGSTVKIKIDENTKRDFTVLAGSVSNLGLAIGALGPAIIPVTAAVVGLGAALAAPVAAAGIGGGLYALVAGKAVKDTEAQSKAIEKLKAKVDAAQQSLNNAGTKATQKTAAAKLAEDTAAYEQALKKLSPQQQQFLTAQHNLGKAFQALQTSAGTTVFGPLTEGMNLLAKDMPKVAPVLKSVSGALTDLIREAGNSGALNSLIKFTASLAGPSIRSAGHILGDMAVGAGGLVKALVPLSTSLGRGLENLAANFASFGRGAGSNKGLQSFMAYVERVGPKVATTVGDVTKALVHIGIALAPLGSVSLGALDELAKLINKIPPDVLGGIATAVVAVGVALKALMIARAVAGAFVALDAAMDANPIGVIILALAALAAGLVYAYKHSSTFRDIVNSAFRGVAVAAKFMWNVVKPIFKFVANEWILTAQIIVGGAAKAFGWIPDLGGKLKRAAAAVAGFRDDVNNTLDGVHPNITVHVDTSQALAAIAAVKGELGSVKPIYRTDFYVTQVNAINKGRHATGGAITGPGTGTSDSIPAMLSNGEFVVNAASASRNRALLEAINAQGYATGGTVTPTKAQRAAEKAAAAQRARRKKQLEAELAAEQKKLDAVNQTLTNISDFASAFAPNAFSAGLATTRDVTKPGGVMTQLINGQVVTTHGAGTTSTVNLSNKQILAEMTKYIKGQATQDHQLAKNIKKLKSEGVPTSVIAQMQAAGPEGIAEINALASGTKAQVQQFNHYNHLADTSLRNAGAYGYTGQRFAATKKRQQNIEDIEKAINKSIRGLTVKVVSGSKLRVTG